MTNSSFQEPKTWNKNELRIADALDAKRKIRKPDLDNNVHTIFDRNRWLNTTDAEYDLLLPSIRLATQLLEIGMPYLTNFLPSNQIHDKFKGNIPSDMGRFDRFMKYYHITIKPLEEVTVDALEKAKSELEDIAKYVTWRVDNTMFQNKTWLGITRLVPDKYAPPPYIDLTGGVIQIADRDAQDQGSTRRPLLVGIMRQYINALKQYKEQTEPHIRATFLAGYTMAHEIGHVVWAQDFRSIDYSESGLEPWVANDPINELGSSFMSWIFSGYDPNIKQKDDRMFESNLIWEYRPRSAARKATDLYSKQFSASLKYMEEMLDKSTWAAISQPQKTTAWSKASRTKFKPDVSSSATATINKWKLEGRTPQWCRSVYSERSGISGDPEPTEKEIELMHLNNPRDEEEGDLAQLFISKSRANIEDFDIDRLREREIYDGILKQDKQLTQDGMRSNITRVWVTYRPEMHLAPAGLNITKKRPHSGRDGENGNSGKQRRLISSGSEDKDEVAARNEDKEIRFSDSQEYDCRDVHQVLENISVEAVTCLTLYYARLYCHKHDIEFPYSFQEDVAWQDQQLNREQHLQLISRIRMFQFLKAEELFAKLKDDGSLVLIRRERIESLEDWADEDIQKTLKHEGLIWEDDEDENRNRLQMFFEKQIQAMKTPGVQSKAFAKRRENPIYWTEDQQTKFLELHNLPRWGDRETRAARIGQYIRALDKPEVASRKGINRDENSLIKRIDSDGNERYVWDVVLQATRVETLKNELFKKGAFPYNCSLKLYFGTDRQSYLEDGKWLWEYDPVIVKDYYALGGAQWKDLWVAVTLPEPKPKPKPKPNPKPTNIVYLPRDLSFRRGAAPRANVNGKIVYSPGDSGDDAGSDNAGTMTIWKSGKGSDKSTSISHASPDDLFEAPEYLKRAQHIIDHPEDMNIAELIESIANDQATMNQAMRPGGGFDSSLRPNGALARVAGAAEMLDNLQDRMVEEDERRDIVRYETTDPDERPVLPARPLKLAKDDDMGMAPDGIKKSHMRSIYDLIPQAG